jgi:hypothetical protein
MSAREMKKCTKGFTIVQRIRYDERVKVDELIDVLNEWCGDPEDDDRPVYTLERASSGYVVVATWPSGGQDRGSLLKCDACKEYSEYFDGQILGCDWCDHSWSGM